MYILLRMWKHGMYFRSKTWHLCWICFIFGCFTATAYYTRNSGSSSCIRCGGKYTYTLLKNLLDVCNPIFNLQTKFDEIGWKLL